MQHLQHLQLVDIAKSSEAKGLLNTAYVFDSVWVLGESFEHLEATFRTISAEQWQDKGLQLALKYADGRKIEGNRDGPPRSSTNFVPPTQPLEDGAESALVPGDCAGATCRGSIKRAPPTCTACDSVEESEPPNAPMSKHPRTTCVSGAGSDSDSDVICIAEEQPLREVPRVQLYEFEATLESLPVLRRLYTSGLHCILWGCVALNPALAGIEDVLTFSTKRGPHTYASVENKIQTLARMVPAVARDISQRPGDYLVCAEAGHGGSFGHCIPIRSCGPGVVYKVVPKSDGTPMCCLVNTDEFDGLPVLQLIAARAAAPHCVDAPVKQTLAGGKRQGTVPTELHRSNVREMRACRAALDKSRKRHAMFGLEGQWRCPLCPWKMFETKQKCQEHFDKYHSRPESPVPSTKQLRVMSALWNWDQLARAASVATDQAPCPLSDEYLARRASQLRAHMTQSPGWARVLRANAPRGASRAGAHLDDHLTLLLDGEGTRYILRQDQEGYHRISSQ